MRKLFYLLLALPLALATLSCDTEPVEQSKPTISVTSGDVVELPGEGGEAEITIEVANGQDNKVNISESATWLSAEQQGSIIKLTAKANDTTEARETVVTLKYYASSAKIIVKQAASEYDVVFEVKRFEGVYFGTEYSSTHNYYMILSDVGVKTDASTRANGTYYYFDLYRNIPADEMNPELPEGEYKLDATNSYADKTISDEGSWYAVTGADGKVTKSASFQEATVTVKNGKFTAVIVMDNGERHYVSYEGDLIATTHLSTFTEDVEFAVEGAEITATCYGDTYNKGQQTWYIEAVKGNDYFSIEVLSPSTETCEGIYQALASSGVTDYSNKFIPGLLGEGLVGSWYAKLTDNVIKGDVMAPMVGGMIQLLCDGDTITINYSCNDDAGNNITGYVKGNIVAEQ